MTQELVLQVVTGVLVAIVSATAGAAYQLHRRRSRPFSLVSKVDGYVLSKDTLVSFPAEVLRDLDACAFLGRPSEPYDMSDVYRVLADIGTVDKHGPVLKRELESALSALQTARSPAETLRATRQPLTLKFFDGLLVPALDRGRIRIAASGATQEHARVFESDEEGGQFQLALPQGAVTLGQKLKVNPLIRSAMEPLVQAIRFADRDIIIGAFSKLLEVLESEIHTAGLLKPRLERLREENARWGFATYIANYGETAMFILPSARLEVRHSPHEKPVVQDCYMVVTSSRDGQGGARDEENGLLVPPSDDAEFWFLTSKIQGDMGGGNELRGRFKDGHCQARLTFQVVSASIPSRRSARTRWFPFRSSAASKVDAV